MKSIRNLIFISMFLASSPSIAGATLATVCKNYGGTLFERVTIKNYNFNTMRNEFNVRSSQSSTAWYHATKDNASLLYDIVKTARLTGEKVDICVNPNGSFFLGIEWSFAVN